jgi:hypothetical protein
MNEDGIPVLAEVLLDGQYGRKRAAVIRPDGALYTTTSNLSNVSAEDRTPPPGTFEDYVVRIAPEG